VYRGTRIRHNPGFPRSAVGNHHLPLIPPMPPNITPDFHLPVAMRRPPSGLDTPDEYWQTLAAHVLKLVRDVGPRSGPHSIAFLMRQVLEACVLPRLASQSRRRLYMSENGGRVSRQNTQPDRIRIVFIMGVGRSGSTLLDTILGNHPDMEGVGELCNISENGWIANRYCACGQRVNNCPFWSEVRREWAERTGTGNEYRYASLIRALEKRRAWLGRLAQEIRRGSSRVQEYLELTKALFEGIKIASGKSIIVDSSKRASRALLLSQIPEVDLHVIHLVRDVRGVVWSKKKSFPINERAGLSKGEVPQSSVRSSLAWNLVNVVDEWTRRRLFAPKSIRVRYEDCVAHPKETLPQIGRLIDVDLSELAEAIVAGEQMEIGHTISGNYMRMAGPARVRPDTAWIEKLPSWDRRVCWMLSGWLMRRYGYRRKPDVLPPPPEATPSSAAESDAQRPREMAA